MSTPFSVVSIRSATAADAEDEDSDDGPSTSSNEEEEVENEKGCEAAAPTSSDPSDIHSHSFDPQRALLDNNFDLSFAAGVDASDNVEKLATSMEGAANKNKAGGSGRGKKEKIGDVGPTVRRFDESQMPIRGKAKRPRNILHYMKKCRDQGRNLEKSLFHLSKKQANNLEA